MHSLTFYLCLPTLVARVGEAPEAQEYLYKSVLLGKVAEYVQWPTEDRESPFVIGVLGKSPFGDALSKTYADFPIKGRRVEMLYFSSLKEISKVDVLFICTSERPRLQSILVKLEGSAVLTMGDSEGYARAGVMVNILVVEGKPSFQVNLQKARQANLKINSHFLKLAKEVIQ